MILLTASIRSKVINVIQHYPIILVKSISYNFIYLIIGNLITLFLSILIIRKKEIVILFDKNEQFVHFDFIDQN